MRLLLCCAAIVVALLVAACGSDSGSSTNASDGQSTTGTTTEASAPAQRIVHYINKYPRPRNPGAHPGARVDHLIVRDIRKGTGPVIQAGDNGQFEFIATNWTTGRPLEAAWHKKRTFETQIEHGVVIDGWWQGIPGMRVGGRRQIIIPPSLGFTTNPDPQIASATTFFDIVLLQVNPQQPSGLGGTANGGVDEGGGGGGPQGGATPQPNGSGGVQIPVE
jgi:FKBP-type peptidyl-prolyl cis-trans isomerase